MIQKFKAWLAQRSKNQYHGKYNAGWNWACYELRLGVHPDVIDRQLMMDGSVFDRAASDCLRQYNHTGVIPSHKGYTK